jgi:branched chain amino acid efflux pump
MNTTVALQPEPARTRPVKRKQEPTSIRAGAKAVLPLAAGSLGFGVSFGLLARAGDLGWPAPLVMSATAFTGTAQFAAVSVLAAGGSLIGAIAAAACLNARYVAMSIAAAPSFRGSFTSRLLRSQFIVDEAWAIANRGRGRFDLKLLVGAGMVLWTSWVSGTTIGLFGGAVLSHPERLGLDAVAPALFLALLARHAHGRGAAAAALATLLSLSLVPVLPAGLPIVAASLAATIGWWSR